MFPASYFENYDMWTNAQTWAWCYRSLDWYNQGSHSWKEQDLEAASWLNVILSVHFVCLILLLLSSSSASTLTFKGYLPGHHSTTSFITYAMTACYLSVMKLSGWGEERSLRTSSQSVRHLELLYTVSNMSVWMDLDERGKHCLC